MLRLMREHGLPEPLVNASLGGFELDFCWPQQRLVVEVDGHAFHLSRAAVERDRHRDATLVAGGWNVLRFTWTQVTRRPDEVIAAVVAGLAPCAPVPQGRAVDGRRG